MKRGGREVCEMRETREIGKVETLEGVRALMDENFI